MPAAARSAEIRARWALDFAYSANWAELPGGLALPLHLLGPARRNRPFRIQHDPTTSQWVWGRCPTFRLLQQEIDLSEAGGGGTMPGPAGLASNMVQDLHADTEVKDFIDEHFRLGSELKVDLGSCSTISFPVAGIGKLLVPSSTVYWKGSFDRQS